MVNKALVYEMTIFAQTKQRMSAWFLSALNSILPLLVQALVLDPNLNCLNSWNPVLVY